MGIFDFFKKKKKPEQQTSRSASSLRQAPASNPQPGPSSRAPFSNADFERVIKTVATMSYLFRDSSTLKSTGGGRNQRMMSTLHSYAGMIGYLYQFTYKLGDYSTLVDKDMNTHFALVTAAMSDPNNRQRSIKQLADNWSDVLKSVLYLQIDGTTEGNKMKAMQADIDFVTKVFETLSGSKCRKPVNQMQSAAVPKPQAKDKFSTMVENAPFNPFKITTNPSLQPTPALPDMVAVFKKELTEYYNIPGIRQQLDEMQIFSAYVFNMVESYFNNAGYVPKNTVDAIIEQCYKALSQTSYGSFLGTLDQVKSYMYHNFLTR